MSASTVIEWEGLTLAWTDDGGLELTDVSVGHAPFAMLAVEMEGWSRESIDGDDEECETVWTRGEASARTRFRAVAACRATVEISGPQAVSVPPASLAIDSRWPVQSWLAGGRGFVVLDPGRDDGRLLALIQEAGDCRASSGRRWLTPIPTRLPGDGRAVRATWTLRWVDGVGELAGRLPPWWPAQTALASGDELVLNLPDAAIEAAGVHSMERGDDGLALVGREGVHLARVHEARGSTDVHLWWAPELRTELGRRVDAALAVDSRRSSVDQAWIVNRGLGSGLPLGHDAASWLAAASEELVARVDDPASPLVVALLADQAACVGDEALLAEALRGLAVLPGVVGRQLAWLHVLLACQICGHTPPAPPPVPDVVDFPTLLAAAEGQVFRRHDDLAPPDVVWRALGVLGRGLPGDTVDQRARAQALAIAGFCPERWDFAERWASSLARVTTHATRRLLAEACPDEVFAWLLW